MTQKVRDGEMEGAGVYNVSFLVKYLMLFVYCSVHMRNKNPNLNSFFFLLVSVHRSQFSLTCSSCMLVNVLFVLGNSWES